jgi:hypothetical protein
VEYRLEELVVTRKRERERNFFVINCVKMTDDKRYMRRTTIDRLMMNCVLSIRDTTLTGRREGGMHCMTAHTLAMDTP